MNRLGTIRIGFLLYAIFVVYGSLVPLDFHSMPLAEAVERFQHLRYLNLGVDSRADWVANLLLFIPLAFLAMASLDPGRIGQRVATALAVILLCAALAIGIEFIQQFFPPRTTSQNDVYAELLGAVVGIAAWWRWGDAFSRWLADWWQVSGPATLAEKLLWSYLALTLAYGVLPLDLTISPVELYHKWSEGRINLIPFGFSPRPLAEFSYAIATDMLLWVPVSLLWSLSGRVTRARAFLLTIAIAALLECLQLFVYSRVTDITDILTAAAGAWAGLQIAKRFAPTEGQIGIDASISRLLLAILTWMIVLAAVFWYPFDFHLDLALLRERIPELQKVPFQSYYYGTELRAITELLHKVLMFLPLGILLAWLWLTCSKRPPRLNLWVIMLLAIPPVVIELGQLGLPGKYPDSTDIALEWLGGLIGYLGTGFVRRRWQASPQDSSDTGQHMHGAAIPSSPLFSNTTLGFYIGGQVLLVCLIMLAGVSDNVPYNLRELMDRLPIPVAALALALALDLVFVGSALAGIWMVNVTPRHAWQAPTVLLTLSIVLYLVLRSSVPIESLHDIVGSPVLDWSDELETLARFAALALFFLIALAGGSAAWCAVRAPRMGIYARWFLVSLPIIGLCHLVVIEHAGTDNLTELMRGGGNLGSTLLLVLWLWVLAVAAGIVAAAAAGKTGYGVAVVTALISVPLGYGLISLATAPAILKYNQTFSALQFLLSADRSHLVSGSALIQRYAMAHVSILLIMALTTYPLWQWIGSPAMTATLRKLTGQATAEI